MRKYLTIVCLLISLVYISSCEEEIPKEAPVINWTDPADISQGTQLTDLQLNATSDISGEFIYTPDFGTSLDVGDNQELSVEFIPDDQDQYRNTMSTVMLNVSEGTDAVFKSDVSYGMAVDIDGNEYKTVTIGTQTWMAENLKVSRFRNGEVIPVVTENEAWRDLSGPGVSNYDNTENLQTVATHGRLYNWAAVNDSRKIAPEGWHVATDEEWSTLTTFLGGEAVAGGKLKEVGQTHWSSPNTGADNSSGFTGLPSGRREYADGTFLNLNFNAYWWTASTYDGNYAWYRYMGYNETNIYRANFHSTYGYSVRCVKDL